MGFTETLEEAGGGGLQSTRPRLRNRFAFQTPLPDRLMKKKTGNCLAVIFT